MTAPAVFSTTLPFRLALIGAGAMGANYIKASQSEPRVRIAAVVDVDLARANPLAAGIGARAAASVEHAGDFDGAIVAVPSTHHRAVAEPLLARGIPCLVEKPFALTPADCAALMRAAAHGRACLQIGHVERFNAAVQALLALGLDPAGIRSLRARRMNAGSARVTDIDVVLDLMVHDIDVVLALKRTPIKEIRAAGTKDHAEASLVFEDGATATLIASRATAGRTRDLSVEMQDGATYSLDFLERRLSRDSHMLTVAGDANSLGRQMLDFARAVRSGAAPQVGADFALKVMEVAWRVREILRLS